MLQMDKAPTQQQKCSFCRRGGRAEIGELASQTCVSQFGRLTELRQRFSHSSNPVLPHARQARRLRCDKGTLRRQIDADEGAQALRVDRQEPLRRGPRLPGMDKDIFQRDLEILFKHLLKHLLVST